MDEMVPSLESLATKDYTSNVHSSRAGEAGKKTDTGIIEEAESSLRESGCLNYEETLSKAVELLPELCKLADAPREAIMSYHRAHLHHWDLDIQTTAKIQKEFAIFLLYSGGESCPPTLRSQMDGSFVPRNNIEEAILLLMILVRKISLQRIEWDPSIIDHLSYALSISGGLKTLASKVEELLPRTIN
ncbi:hypothetical protein RND71_013985 [Anisodus tanguticus]|uniref:Uncharacterized protein n=1 Tax=Anisodus tanguticus TaxID=243964 RepID=A0AAE1S9X2_9SOLA|nr:hypothetical protein RND71_013985 [Anisodus tanguticus]